MIIADMAKGSDVLGDFAIPVEVTPFGKEITLAQLTDLGCLPAFRKKDNELYVTDNQNYIVDCKFADIQNPADLNEKMNAIPGVVENGLFVGMANVIITDDGNSGIIVID